MAIIVGGQPIVDPKEAVKPVEIVKETVQAVSSEESAAIAPKKRVTRKKKGEKDGGK